MDAVETRLGTTHGGFRIASLAPSDCSRWDRFVTAHPAGTFFHLSGWQEVLRRAFGHDTFYMFAELDGAIAGVLPLARVRSLLFGNALVSTPFCVYGGILAVLPGAQRALEEAACALARDLGVDYLEMRNLIRRRPDWPCKDLYVTFRKEIQPDAEKNLAAIPRKQRAMIRKGIAAGLRIEIDAESGRLYDAYSESLRNLGTPVFARRYLDLLLEVFGPSCEIQTVVQGRDAVASVMSFYFRDEVLPYYGGGTAQARDCAANDFMYWELMRRAAERGVRIFDYGRSKQDTGAFRFKAHWGFEPQPLFYEYFLVRAASMPNLSPANPKYRLLIETWKRLPLAVTHWIGPALARNLG